MYEKVVHSDRQGASVHATKLSDMNDLGPMLWKERNDSHKLCSGLLHTSIHENIQTHTHKIKNQNKYLILIDD